MRRNAEALLVRYLLPFPSLLFAFFLTGCTAPNVKATVDDVPICPDFVVGGGGHKMKGSLKKPVVVNVLDDDEDLISSRTLLGRRTAESPVPPVVVQDTDETFIIAWSQCANQRAPQAVVADLKHRSHTASYDCGKAKEYGRTKLSVRKGDKTSRVIKYLTPPEPQCWTSTGPGAAADSSSAATAKPAPDSTSKPVTNEPGEQAQDDPTAGASTSSATSSPTSKPTSSPTSKPTSSPTSKPTSKP